MESTYNSPNGSVSDPIAPESDRRTLSDLLKGGKFYHGPDVMCAPHLPVGSPERAALFRELRKTFVEDWKAAEEAVKQERIDKKGDLYFVRAGDAVKIGYTVDIVNRLSNIQAHCPDKVDCLLLLRGQGWREKEWHKRFEDIRLRGEWFLWYDRLERAIDLARNAQVERLNA